MQKEIGAWLIKGKKILAGFGQSHLKEKERKREREGEKKEREREKETERDGESSFPGKGEGRFQLILDLKPFRETAIPLHLRFGSRLIKRGLFWNKKILEHSGTIIS